MICQQLYSALSIDGISNVFLHFLEKLFAEAIAELTQACWRISYYPAQFQKARTVALHKPSKENYINLRA